MPRPRTTDREIRAKFLKKAIERARIDLGIDGSDFDTYQYLGERQSTYSMHKKDPLKSLGFEKAIDYAEKYRFTARELLDIFGMQL